SVGNDQPGSDLRRNRAHAGPCRTNPGGVFLFDRSAGSIQGHQGRTQSRFVQSCVPWTGVSCSCWVGLKRVRLMIKVNLVGADRKKPKAGLKVKMPDGFTPVLSILIVLGTAGGGYRWYSSQTAKLADLDSKKVQAEKQKAELDAVIKADQVYEARKR